MKYAQKLRPLPTILLGVSLLTAPINYQLAMLRSRSLSFTLFTISLLVLTPMHCQYLITADDSYCLAIGTESGSLSTNHSQLFWSNISDSSNCINWAFEKHFDHETQSIYNGKLYVNGIGPNAINQQSYLNQRMFVDDTDFEFIQAQSQLPTSQRSQAVGYDSTNNVIELIGGSPSVPLHVQYRIDSDSFSSSLRFCCSQASHGQSYTSTGDVLWSFDAWRHMRVFNMVTSSSARIHLDSMGGGDLRYGCMAAIDDDNIFLVHGQNTGTRVYNYMGYIQWGSDYNAASGAYYAAPSLHELHYKGTCQIVNDYLYVIGGNGVLSIEKLYVDISNINGYSFEYLSESLIVSGFTARSEVIGNNIFIQTEDTAIQVLDTVTGAISIIGYINAIGSHAGTILVHNTWYLFGIGPSISPTPAPSNAPSLAPSAPSLAPSIAPSNAPTNLSLTPAPTNVPVTSAPTNLPTIAPTISNRNWFFYDFSVDTDVNIADTIKANGVDEFEFDMNQNTLKNTKYGSDSIHCALGMSANESVFLLDDNTTIDGYAARFDCSNSSSVASVAIHIAYQGELFYVFQKQMLDFDDSDASCRFNYDEHLASIHNKHQNEEAIAKMSLYQAEAPSWFGLNDIESEGTWTNMDTTPWDYGLTPGSSPWHTTQPDGGSGKNCATLATYCDLYENTGPVEFALDNCQGTVSIPDTFGMSFDFTIDTWSDTHNGYIHLFDINEPASGMIAFRYGRRDESPYNGAYLLYFKFALSGNPVVLDSFTIDRSGNDDGKTFHLEALVTQTTVVISIDGMVVSDTTKLPHEALTDVPICFATERAKPGRIADFRIWRAQIQNLL